MPMAPCLFGAKDNTTVGRLHKLCRKIILVFDKGMNNEHMEIGVVVFYSPRFASAYRAGFAVAGCHSHENMCMPSVALIQNHAVIVCIAGHYATITSHFFLMGPWAKNNPSFYASFYVLVCIWKSSRVKMRGRLGWRLYFSHPAPPLFVSSVARWMVGMNHTCDKSLYIFSF